MVMPQRRGRDVTIAKLARSTFTATERMGFEEVDVQTQAHAQALKNMNTVKHTPM